MILSEGGKITTVGSFDSLFVDLTCLLRAMVDRIEAESDRDTAERYIALSGRFALMDIDEVAERCDELKKEYGLDSRL